MSELDDQVGPGSDLLKEHGLDAAARALEDHDAAITFLEGWARGQMPAPTLGPGEEAFWGPILALIARCRDETPEQALRRLARPYRPRFEASNETWNHDVPSFALSGFPLGVGYSGLPSGIDEPRIREMERQAARDRAHLAEIRAIRARIADRQDWRGWPMVRNPDGTYSPYRPDPGDTQYTQILPEDPE